MTVTFRLADTGFTYLISDGVNPPRIGSFIGASHDDTVAAQEAVENVYSALGATIVHVDAELVID